MKIQKFVLGNIVLIEKLPCSKVKAPQTKLGWHYVCRARYKCFCGKEFISICSAIKNGKTKSCGCYKKYKNKYINLSHGQSKTRLYDIYIGMIKRTTNPTDNNFKYYKGKGIIVCAAWKNFMVFKKWAENNGYREHLTIDRINGNGNYTPKNCRWVTRKIQSINLNHTKSKSGITGVHKHRLLNNKYSYRAAININKKRIHLGTFDSEEEACLMYELIKNQRNMLYIEEFNNAK